MAHNLHSANGKTSFVAVGEKAWHGLGQYVDTAMTAEEAIRLGGLDYQVEKRRIMAEGGLEFIDGHVATVRTDSNEVLGIVSPSYHIVQNHEAFGFFDSIIDRGEAIYQTAGVLGKGERIFITAKLPEDIVVGGEKVENYILLSAGHDGRTPIQAGFTSIRVVCNNTLTVALRNLQNRVTILHFASAQQKLQAAARVMGMSSIYTQLLQKEFDRMAQVKINDDQLRAYIQEVMKPERSQTVTKDELADHSTIFKKKVDEIMFFAESHHTQNTEAARGTLWGAYNSISGYYSYLKNYKSQQEKMKDVYFKGGAQRIERAFEVASAMLS